MKPLRDRGFVAPLRDLDDFTWLKPKTVGVEMGKELPVLRGNTTRSWTVNTKIPATNSNYLLHKNRANEAFVVLDGSMGNYCFFRRVAHLNRLAGDDENKFHTDPDELGHQTPPWHQRQHPVRVPFGRFTMSSSSGTSLHVSR